MVKCILNVNICYTYSEITKAMQMTIESAKLIDYQQILNTSTATLTRPR